MGDFNSRIAEESSFAGLQQDTRAMWEIDLYPKGQATIDPAHISSAQTCNGNLTLLTLKTGCQFTVNEPYTDVVARMIQPEIDPNWCVRL